jgi:hypothetical protein
MDPRDLGGGAPLEYDTAALETTSRTFRSDMWQTACEDAVLECGIAETWFGLVQVTAFQALPDLPLFNCVLGAAEPEAVQQGHLATAIEWIDSLGVDYWVPVARRRPGTAAAEAWLQRNHFEQGPCTTKYVRDTSPPSPPGRPEVKVWEIGSEDAAAAETMVFDAAPALGMPTAAANLLPALPGKDRWRTYTVELDDRIAAFGSLLICNGVAELGLDATVEGFRGRGCNQALLRRRILDAAAAGCHTVFTERARNEPAATASAARNLIRFGFIPISGCVCWQRSR